MAVAFDAISGNIVKSQVNIASATGTASHTVSASATIAILFIESSYSGGNSDATISFDTLTLGSSSFTQVTGARAHSGGGNHGFCDLYYILNPPTGSQTLTVTMHNDIGGTVYCFNCFSVSYTGTLQSGSELGTAKTNTTNGSSQTVTDTLASGDLFVGIACNGSSTPTVTTGTSRGSQAGDTSTASHAGIRVADNSGTGSVNIVFGQNAGDSSGACAVRLTADTGGGGGLDVPYLQSPVPQLNVYRM